MALLNQFTLHIKSVNQKIPTAEMLRYLCRLQRWRRHLCYFYSVRDTVALCPSLLTKTLSWVTPCCLYCLMQFLWDKFREGELRDWGDASEPERLASHNGASTDGAASHDVFLQQRTEACSVLLPQLEGDRWVPWDFWSQRRSSLGRQGDTLRCPP